MELRLGEVGDQRWALTRGGLGGPAAAGRSHGWPPHGWVDLMENPMGLDVEIPIPPSFFKLSHGEWSQNSEIVPLQNHGF